MPQELEKLRQHLNELLEHSRELTAKYEELSRKIKQLEKAEKRDARPASGQRDSVTVCIAGRNYLGGLRTFQGRTYLCPDLVSESDNQLVKLADLLSDIGIAPKDQIDVLIDAGKWTIPA